MTKKGWMILGSVLAALATIAVVGVIVVGGGEDEVGPAGAPPQGFAPSQELQDCLAEQGIEPGSGPPAGGPPDADLQEAFEACQEFAPALPEGGQFPGAPPGSEGGFTPPSS